MSRPPCRSSDGRGGTITVIDTASHRTVEMLAVDEAPETLAVDAEGLLYVTHYNANSVSVVDPGTQCGIAIALDDAPMEVVARPESEFVYTANSHSVTAIDTSTGATKSLALGELPRRLSSVPTEAAVCNGFRSRDHLVSGHLGQLRFGDCRGLCTPGSSGTQSQWRISVRDGLTRRDAHRDLDDLHEARFTGHAVKRFADAPSQADHGPIHLETRRLRSSFKSQPRVQLRCDNGTRIARRYNWSEHSTVDTQRPWPPSVAGHRSAPTHALAAKMHVGDRHYRWRQPLGALALTTFGHSRAADALTVGTVRPRRCASAADREKARIYEEELSRAFCWHCGGADLGDAHRAGGIYRRLRQCPHRRGLDHARHPGCVCARHRRAIGSWTRWAGICRLVALASNGKSVAVYAVDYPAS